MARIVARCLAAAFLICASARAQASKTVTIDNTAANPVPTTVTNTPSVTVANTPSVTVSGTASVNVANTPAVTISGTPTVSLASTPGNPYREILFATFTGLGSVTGTSGLVVPAGQHRIVTTISAQMNCAIGHAGALELFASSNSFGAHLFFPLQLAYSDALNGFSLYTMLIPLNFVMPAGTQFIPIISVDGTHCSASIQLVGTEVPD